MSAPFMQLYVGDYLRDTRHLTAEQHGAYLLLLMAAWNAGGRLPNDPRKLARLAASTPSRWAKISADLLEFFEVDGDHITNRRLTLELKKASEKSIKRADAGMRGGNATALKTKGTDAANATVLPQHSSEPEPEKIDNPSGYCRPKADALPVQEAFDEWNATATRRRLPIAKSLTTTRRKQIKARLADGGIAGWREALSAVEASPMCLGENDRGWRADLDFLCQPKSFARLREGSYAPAGKPGQSPPRPPAEMSPELIARRRALLEQAPEQPSA
jgi:uncharacterized protein YdaU (DUF1376 family)